MQIATRLTPDSHPLSVNARPVWINIYPALYLSDSHLLSVDIVFDRQTKRQNHTGKE